jgi:glycosyltransferase involved in cell wall biosynthesis
MHVMVANNIYPPIVAGGAELIVSYLCEGLVARGHRVTVVSTCAPEMEPYPVELRNGVEVIRFFPPNLYWSFDRDRRPGLKKWLWHARDAWNWQAGDRLRDILAMARPDVLHTHLIDGMSAAMWGRARRAGVPVIHTAHDYHLLCPRAFLLTKDWKLCNRPQLACRAYRHWHVGTTRYVDMFTSPSRFLLETHEKAGLRVAQRAVVHNGIPQPTDVARIRNARPKDAHAKFLMLTRLTVEKGVQVVLDAMAQLPPDLDIEVTIAGKGPLETQVTEAAARDPRLKYLGYVGGDGKLTALSQAGYLLLPSLWYENAPVVIVEAAAYGLGLIGSNIGGIPEFVEEGKTGFLFPPGDAAALAALMTRVARDPNALPDLASRSQALAQRFTVDRMADAYEAHYENLTNHQPMALAAD